MWVGSPASFLCWRKVVKSTSLIHISLKCDMVFDINVFLELASPGVFTRHTQKALSHSSGQVLAVTGINVGDVKLKT